MKSFKSKLIFNFMSIIFINFILIYFLFNFIMDGYIKGEVEKEFNSSSNNIVFNLPSNFMDIDLEPSVSYSTNFITTYNQEEDIIITNYDSIFYSPNTTNTEINYNLDINTQSLFELEYIIIEDTKLIKENDDSIDNKSKLFNYYIENENKFNYDEMVRVVIDSNTYYIMPTMILSELGLMPMTTLLYSDISSAVILVDTINKILGFILIISSLLTIFIGLYMTSQFENAIVKLCKYAENIGHGKFKEEVKPFEYVEFTKLSNSLNNMSNMLYDYENNQRQFFQNVSHELRTPLMSIQGYSEGILEDIIDKTDASKVILFESKKMATLVNELLYISRMDSGLEELNVSSISIKNILYHCLETLKIIAEKLNKTIILDLTKEDIMLIADEDKLSRAIINVISNGIRHANSTVNIIYYEEDSNLKVSIIDDGEGIELNEIKNIFNRFYKGKNGNTGLGLSISKDIITAHEGTIEVENTNQGAKFTFTIPIKQNI